MRFHFHRWEYWVDKEWEGRLDEVHVRSKWWSKPIYLCNADTRKCTICGEVWRYEFVSMRVWHKWLRVKFPTARVASDRVEP